MTGRVPNASWFAAALMICLLQLTLAGVSGCGRTNSSSTQSASDTSPAAPATPHGPALPVAAISAVGERDEADESPMAPPKEGTPEWLLREIARLRTELSASPGGPQWSARSQAQHEQIIELARQAIAATHTDAQRTQVFNNAVHYLSDSRLELAMHGETQQSQLLIDDAESLFRRDPQSFAAVESAFKVVQLAQRKAEQLGKQDPDWLSEFANQARVFAEKFPHEPNRSALALLTAGQLCDRWGLVEDAKQCFTAVSTQFPDTIFAEQVSGFLRRLSLVGQPLELAGPTLEGGYVSIDDFRDHVVLVVFWASTASRFPQDCERLAAAQQRFEARGLKLLGVSLDTDEAAIDHFLTDHSLPWPHIFYSEPDQRGGRHPAARYYGVHVVPTYILVDRTGIVVATDSELDQVTTRLESLLAAP